VYRRDGDLHHPQRHFLHGGGYFRGYNLHNHKFYVDDVGVGYVHIHHYHDGYLGLRRTNSHHHVDLGVTPSVLDIGIKACVPFLKLLPHLPNPSHINIQYLVFISLVILWIRSGTNAHPFNALETVPISHLLQAHIERDLMGYGGLHGLGSYDVAERLAGILDDYTPFLESLGGLEQANCKELWTRRWSTLGKNRAANSSELFLGFRL